jgi:hypothetical protein
MRRHRALRFGIPALYGSGELPLALSEFGTTPERHLVAASTSNIMRAQ